MFFIYDLIRLFVMVLIHIIMIVFFQQAYTNILLFYFKEHDSYLDMKDPFDNNSNSTAPEYAEYCIFVLSSAISAYVNVMQSVFGIYIYRRIFSDTFKIAIQMH